MFLLATRNRPDHLAAVIESMRKLGDPPSVAVMHDACEPYKIDWPANWAIHTSEDHLEMTGAINALFRAHPNERWYGYLNDHCHPLRAGWDRAMIEGCGAWRIASAWDTVNRTNPRTGNLRLNCYAMGGELVRYLGWVWPDFVVHLFGDDVIEDIGYGCGILAHHECALMENRMLRDGGLKPDGNSRRIWRGMAYPEHDRAAYLQWRRNEFPGLVDRLSRIIPGTAMQHKEKA